MLPPLFTPPNKPLKQAVLPQTAQSTPAVVPAGWGILNSKPITYIRETAPPAPAGMMVEASDIPLIRDAIAHNESRGKEEPYSFFRFSGVKALGNALGKYQITEGELKTYADRFLGHPVTAATFLANPELQDQYVENKIEYLLGKKLPLEQVLAAHRGGFSNFNNLPKQVLQYQGYVDEGLSKYNDLKNGQGK